MRLFALFMRLVDLVAGRIPWLTLHLALRQLGRQSLDYVQPMLLVIITLAMGVYTLSMAASLDQWAIDRMYYSVGADITFSPQPNSADTTVIDGSWIPLPQEFAQVPGVKAATRVGEFSARLTPVEGEEIRGRLIAIDRVDFPAVAWFRSDFARESLGAIMNRLAFSEDGILLPQKFVDQYNLQIGDTVPMVITIENLMSVISDFTVVGTYDYFPDTTDEAMLVVGNLDYISTLTGLTVAHDIWLKTDPQVDQKTLIDNISSQLSITIEHERDTKALIAVEQGRMERVGIFGTLTVGFLATALMAILGLLIYSYASLQERAYRLAVLNAVGLSRNQIITQVILEYAFLALFGAIAGAVIGSVASNLFVPFFQFTGELGVPLPPLVPIIANTQIRSLSTIFGLSVVGIEILSIGTILNRRLVQILKRVWI
jgi:putative ABC transport system permease protein